MPLPFALTAALLASLTILAPAAAQDARPRVGLTLSGGGARGLAHVGFLQELERMRVPVDLVTGTSMGAIVGGLWASGLPADSIAATIGAADWPTLLNDTPPRASLDFHHRAVGRRYGLETPVGLADGGVRLQGGLVAGQEVGLTLRRLLFPVLAVEDFDRLPIPFAAMATDFERGESVVLSSGDPADAIRASMSIPVVFPPVRIDGRLLVDGGLENNLPVDVTLERGAEVAIAVDVTPKLQRGEEVTTLFGAIEQFAAMIGQDGVDEHRAMADVAVVPDLEGFNLYEFQHADTIVARGAAAARANTAALAAFAVNPAEYATWRASLRPAPLPERIAAIDVRGPEWLDERRVLGRIDLAPGDRLSPEALERAARTTYAIGEFERVDYDVELMDGEAVAVLRPVAPPWGPHSLRFGTRLVTDSGGADLRTGLVAFTLRAAWRRARLTPRGGELWVEGSVGQETGLAARLRQPLDWGGAWFVEPAAGIVGTRQPLFADQDLLAEYDVVRMDFGFDVGRAIGRSAEIRAGIRRGRVDAETSPGDALVSLPELESDLGELAVALAVDRLDDADFPTRGVRATARWRASREGLGADEKYDRVDVSAAAFGTRGSWTGFLSFDGGASPGGGLPAWDEHRAGGFLSLSGYGEGELRGADAAVVRAGLLHRLVVIPPARGVYAGGWVEAGNAWTETEDPALDDMERALTLALVMDTALGPVALAWGWGEGGRDRVYLGVGVAF